MEHIIQFGISIDDEMIERRIRERAEKEVLNQIADTISGELFGRDFMGRPNKGYVSEWVHEKVDKFMTDHKEEIVNNAAERIAEKLARSKAMKAAVEGKGNET